MKIDGVLFIDSEVLKMDRKKFIDFHKRNLYLDLTIVEREKKLSDIYDRISNTIVDVKSDFKI